MDHEIGYEHLRFFPQVNKEVKYFRKLNSLCSRMHFPKSSSVCIGIEEMGKISYEKVTSGSVRKHL